MTANPNPVQLIKDGEPDNASTIDRPLSQIDVNVQQLYNLLNSITAGSALYATGVGISSDCLIGSPVYYSPIDQLFHPAIAATDNVLGRGAVGVSASSRVLGVVYAKRSSGSGDLLIAGTAPLNISAVNADPGAPLPGLYYLSGANAGMLSQQKNPITIPVLFFDGANVYIKIQDLDFLDRHTHYRFSLVCLPAGTTTQPSPGGIHVITASDPTKHGWLPAGHAIFSGLAPPGAFFGYNLSLEPDLQAVLPPIPVSGAYLGWDRALGSYPGEQGARLGHGGYCIVDRNGIWWMTDCYQEVPWPFDYGTIHHINPTSEEPGECPIEPFMRLTLYFTRPTFATEGSLVTSLRTGDPRIAITCFGKTPPVSAAVGDLSIDLNLANGVSSVVQPGGVVFKGYDSKGLILSGPVVEAVYRLSNNVIVTSSQQVVDPITGHVLNYGIIGIDVVPSPQQQLSVTQVRLSAGAEDDFLFNIPFIALRVGQNSKYRASVSIPSTIGSGTHIVAFRFIIMGRIAGTLPTLGLSARVIPRPPSGLSTPQNLPTDSAETALVLNTAATLTAANQYVEALSQGVTVNPGDTVVFYLSRAGATDGYLDDVGIIDQVGILVSS